MLDRLLPRPIDNRYSGSKIALWLFGFVVFIHIVQSVLVIVNGYSIAQSADGIPLQTYSADAAQTVLALFIVGSLRRLIISLMCAVVLFRYRSALPIMFVVLGINYLGSQLVFQFVPLVRVGTPPGVIMNFVMFILTIVGLTLSLWRRGGSHLVGRPTPVT